MSGVPLPNPETMPAPADLRVRRMRLARDACWVVVAGAVGATGLVFLDATIHLPGWVRGVGLAVWITAVGVLAWRLLARRLDPDPTRSPRTELPSNLAAAAAAALSLVGCLLAGALVPGAGEHLRRVALPWQRPAAGPYRIVVTSADAVVRRGEPVTLSAYTEKLTPTAPTPETATLVCHIPGEKEQRHPMTPDETGAFHITLMSVQTNFRYRVESGNAASNWFTVIAIDPAEVAPESVVLVHPPEYAPAVTGRLFPGFGPFDGFQYGTAELRLRFTRPISTALLEWRPDGKDKPELPPVAFSPDLLGATATVPLHQSGTLRLITFTEQNGRSLRWEKSVPVRVTPDQPPRFEKLTGVWVRAVRPGQRLRVEVVATDDIAVGSAMVDYLTGRGDRTPQSMPLTLNGIGTPTASGQSDLNITDQLQPGDTVRFRIRLADTRRLTDPNLKPQETIYPSVGWVEVRIDSSADPTNEQDILGQADALRATLTLARDEVLGAARDAAELNTSTTGQTVLTIDQSVRVRTVQHRALKAGELLQEAARLASLAPQLRPLATTIRDGAAHRVNAAVGALGKAATDNPADRAAALTAAISELTSAYERAQELLIHNERFAQVRITGVRLAALATAQAALADRAGDAPHEELARNQKDLIERLHKRVAESELLRHAVDAAWANEFRRFGATVNELAEQVREVDAAARQLQEEVRSNLLGAILAEYETATKQTTTVLDRVSTAARLGNVTVPRADGFDDIPILLAAGNNLEAMTRLEKFAQGLEVAASAIEKLATDRNDAKLAARQLALWQDDLFTRFRAVTGGQAETFALLPEVVKAAFRFEQAVLTSAVTALGLPPGDEIRSNQTRASEHLAAANRFLSGTGANADTAMKSASEYLHRLATTMPTNAERLRATRDKFDKLRLEQESIQTSTETALRGAEPIASAAVAKRLSIAHDRQRRLLTQFALLDLPDLDRRRERVVAALIAATGDLRDGLPQDVPASQAWVRREFDRLKWVLDGNAAPDDRSEELARRVNAVANAIASIGPKPTERQLEVLAGEVQEIVRQLERFSAPEAPILLHNAREAVREADLSFRNGSSLPEITRRLRLAAESLDRLADRLTGAESELDRVRRLAATRRAGAIEAQRMRDAKATPNPGELARQLSREIDELTLTRVGAAGQLRKKLLIEQYTRLKDEETPEKWVGIQNGIAEKLDELAAVMADVGELSLCFSRTPPTLVRTPVDMFLPSRPMAEELREVAKRQRVIHTQLVNLPGDLAVRLRPAKGNAAVAITERHHDLATQARALAEQLEQPERNAGSAGKAFTAASSSVRTAAKQLTEAAEKMAEGAVENAQKLRTNASVALTNAARTLDEANPQKPVKTGSAETDRGLALLRAEAAMRQVIEVLGQKPDRTTAVKAMRTARDELQKVVNGLAP